MKRNKAKFLTVGGIVCCMFSAVLLIHGLAVKIDVSLLIAALFFVAGIILIILSLAYYTES